METLVIVDFQKDFSNPNGLLYVNGSEKAKEAKYFESKKEFRRFIKRPFIKNKSRKF